ncbi:MAG: 5-formyltetrahydrofolate cyclo-ligase [Eggerthellaceae bacterium]|nr:5-formyltetrahydrofolate cyclo-ligase [Eggerthellaceae bacterium]
MRNEMRARRDAMTSSEHERLDEAICQRLFCLDEYEDADIILTYLGFGSEINTRVIVDDALARKKTVCLPRCITSTHEMSWHEVRSMDGLVKGPFGILEPDPDIHPPVNPSAFGKDSLAIVPGLAFYPDGMRIGYGGGYYDRFLESFGGTSVGLAYDFQVKWEREPECCDDHDVPVGIVLSEKHHLNISGDMYS